MDVQQERQGQQGDALVPRDQDGRDQVHEAGAGARGRSRRAFNSTERGKFLDWAKDAKNVSDADLTSAGFKPSEILEFWDTGKIPKSFQVHHRLPLDDSGTNEFDYLVILKNNPDHAAITQHHLRETCNMVPGQTKTITFPFTPPGAVVWPL